MRDISFFSKIYVAVDPVDFRKQGHGLALIIEHTLKFKPTLEKVLFAFTNKRKTAIKLLHWDYTGYGMWWKVLEKEKFRWPKSPEEVKHISAKEMRWLLEGVDLDSMKKHKKLILD